MRTSTRRCRTAVGRLACIRLGLIPVSGVRAQQALTTKEARAIVRPLYGALTASSREEVRSLLESAVRPDWQNCATNEACETRESTIARWSARVSLVPGMRYEMKEVLVSGDRIIVRGEDTGTPAGPFLGIAAAGRSFSVMTIDIHQVVDGKVVRTHHAEDWTRAMRQLRGDGGWRKRIRAPERNVWRLPHDVWRILPRRGRAASDIQRTNSSHRDGAVPDHPTGHRAWRDGAARFRDHACDGRN